MSSRLEMRTIFKKSIFTTATILLLLPLSGIAADNITREVIELNNNGVLCLERQEFDQAILFLNKAVQKDPSYKLARTNLAIAMNNKGLHVYEKGYTEKSLQLMEASYFNDPTNKTTRYNLDGLIKILKLNPDSPIDRCGLSGKAALRGDGTSAWLELCVAFEKLTNLLFPSKTLLQKAEPELPYNDKSEVFYKSYVNLLNERIKRNWKAPIENSSYTEKIIISVKRNGQMSVITPDNGTRRFTAFKNAIEKSSPAPTLYKDDKERQIRFTFQYNVLKP